jgi:hypothetical protein
MFTAILNFFRKDPPTTSEAISHIMEGIDFLRDVHQAQIEVAQQKREESLLLIAEAEDAQGDAEHAARIIKRAQEFVS